MSSSDEIGKAEQALEAQPIQSDVEIPDGGLQAWLTLVGAKVLGSSCPVVLKPVADVHHSYIVVFCTSG